MDVVKHYIILKSWNATRYDPAVPELKKPEKGKKV